MTEPGFHEEWFCQASQDLLAELYAETVDVPGQVVEIGCWEGRSTVVLANACYPRTLQAVDTWQGSGHEISARLAAERDVFAQWSANVDAYTAGNVIAHRMGWRDWAPTVLEPIAFLFIDAEHSYREVRDNIEALLPWMAAGGIICGDDATYPDVRSAVLDLLPAAEVMHKATLWWWKVPADADDREAARILGGESALRVDHPELAPTATDLAAVMDELQPAHDAYVASVSTTGMAASLQTSALLLWLCRATKARRVLDLGSGFSSYVLNLYATQAGQRVTVLSVDDDEAWLQRSAQYVTDRLPTATGAFITLANFTPTAFDPFDVVLHDIAGGTLREQLTPTALALTAPHGVTVLDDAHHPAHRAVMRREATAAGRATYTLPALTLDQHSRFAMIAAAPPTSLLAAEYERLCATPSDIYLHLPRFAALVASCNAQHVIELGTRTGVSTVAWLYALEQTGGRLTSVDLDARPDIGEWPHWTFIQGDDMDPAVVGQLEPAEIVFIDSSHHYRHTLRELHTYRWLVKPGGLIVCHDTELPVPEGSPAGDPRYPVKRAIEEFTAEAGLEWMNVPDCWGLGIIRVV